MFGKFIWLKQKKTCIYLGFRVIYIQVVESGRKWVINRKEDVSMFIGEYQHSMDSKGRVIMPSKFRENLGSTFYVTKGMENCLFIFDNEEWEELATRINSMNQLSRKEARGFARLFYAGASNIEPDKQGRILLPQNLREYANIDKEVYIIGVAKRIEIWSKENWENYNDDDFLNYDTLTEKMADLNI